MRRLLLLALGPALVACTGDVGTKNDSGSGSMDLAMSTADLSTGGGGDMATCTLDMSIASSYPPGPYMIPPNKGDTFPMLSWMGYRDDAADAIASTKPYVAYSTEDIRTSGKRYAMIHVSSLG